MSSTAKSPVKAPAKAYVRSQLSILHRYNIRHYPNILHRYHLRQCWKNLLHRSLVISHVPSLNEFANQITRYTVPLAISMDNVFRHTRNYTGVECPIGERSTQHVCSLRLLSTVYKLCVNSAERVLTYWFRPTHVDDIRKISQGNS